MLLAEKAIYEINNTKYYYTCRSVLKYHRGLLKMITNSLHYLPGKIPAWYMGLTY